MPSLERKGSGEASDVAKNPMEAFKRLARGLLVVTPDELREEELRYQKKRKAKQIDEQSAKT